MNGGGKTRENVVRQDAARVRGVAVTKFPNCRKPLLGSPSELLRIAFSVNKDVLYGAESHVPLVSARHQNRRASQWQPRLSLPAAVTSSSARAAPDST